MSNDWIEKIVVELPKLQGQIVIKIEIAALVTFDSYEDTECYEIETNSLYFTGLVLHHGIYQCTDLEIEFWQRTAAAFRQ